MTTYMAGIIVAFSVGAVLMVLFGPEALLACVLLVAWLKAWNTT